MQVTCMLHNVFYKRLLATFLSNVEKWPLQIRTYNYINICITLEGFVFLLHSNSKTQSLTTQEFGHISIWEVYDIFFNQLPSIVIKHISKKMMLCISIHCFPNIHLDKMFMCDIKDLKRPSISNLQIGHLSLCPMHILGL